MGQEVCDYLPKPLSVADHLKPGGPYRLYPNPAAKEITFDYGRPLPAGTSLSLFDCLGKIALPAKDISGIDKISLPVKHLVPGLYLLSLQAGDQQFYYKLSIQR